jgi:two-component system KDP operon response regulator KdpE
MSRGRSVLIVDEDPGIRRYLRRALESENYRVTELAAGETMLQRITERPPDLLLLNIDDWDPHALLVLRRIRERSPLLPVVALSARADEETAVKVLDSGADECVRKPFGVRELVARVRAVLRRIARQRGEPPLFISGRLSVDLVARLVCVGGEEVRLTPREQDILHALVRRAGNVLTHEEILDAVWGRTGKSLVGQLRVHVGSLRRKIEADPAHPELIATEPCIGYRLRVVRSGPAGAHRGRASPRRHHQNHVD